MRRSALRRELRDYSKEGERLRNMLEQIRRQQELFHKEADLVGLEAGVRPDLARYIRLLEEDARLESEMLAHRAAYENIKGGEPSAFKIPLELRSLIDADPLIVALRQMRLSIELGLEPVASTQPAAVPTSAPAALSLAAIDARLDALVRGWEERILAHLLQCAEQDYLEAAQAQLALQELVVEAKAKSLDMDAKLSRYRRLTEERESLEKQYQPIADYIYKLHLLAESEDIIHVRQVGTAQPPVDRNYRPQIRLTGIAVGGPAGVAILLLVVRALTRKRRAG